MKHTLLLILVFSFFYHSVFSQTARIKHVGATPLEIVADELGQVYIVDEDNVITKYHQNGTKIASHSDRKLAKVKFDASNIFQLVAYYRDFNKLFVLNSNLGVMESIDLNNLTNLNIESVVTIPDKTGFWILDANSNQIKIISNTGKIVENKSNLPGEKINQFFTVGDKLYIATEGNIIEYNYNWEELRRFPNQDIPFVAIYKGHFIGNKGNQLLELITETGQYVPFKFPFEKDEKETVFFSNNTLFLLRDGIIYVY